ncbi:hypothetical protein D9619_008113 [Psilocybe cf. subviscida]|uniref:Uncharacterized protein n=1 Tax=Psilocybe cf. subviscida TaxID=2480587 RepID=A0A8H5ESE6_9AGAR|nr:hypothetical protein D9619_008113 [Psilocybe cf. subviscida]
MSSVLIQKPHQHPFNHPAPHHRRLPSAPPAVVVQPTRTPGLLAVKHANHASNRSSAQRRDNQPKNAAAQTPKSAQGVRAQLVPAPAQGPAAPSASPNHRGRSQAKHPKDKAATAPRSNSPSTHRGKHGRQPSPPIPTITQSTPSQAEATVISTVKSTNLFDPFTDTSIPNAFSNNSPPSSPTLTSKPSGKLARRREQVPSSGPLFPRTTKAIPVPSNVNNNKRSDKHGVQLSRSVPDNSNVNMIQRPRQVPQRSTAYADFPVCDDASEYGAQSPPTTPTLSKASVAAYHNAGAQRSAPALSQADRASAYGVGAFPFPTSKPTTTPRKHRRVPSEGVFGMSSDEEASTGAVGTNHYNSYNQSAPALNENVAKLFGLYEASVKAKRMSSPPGATYSSSSSASSSYTGFGNSFATPASQVEREKKYEREAAEKLGYYASSMFQNSPSPDELPDPLLL